jgi:aspartate carbamoyltransferase catalytic subunit
MRSFAGRDILSLKDFERNEFFRVFEIAEKLEPIARNRRNSDLLKEKTLVTAFYQPSTRTRLAHEAAMIRLGGQVTGFSDAKATRAGDFYQESIKDTVKMLEFYGDIIVMRHFQQGAPHEAAKWASIPIINGGDGWGEHPTQVLTDFYTVLREKGRLDGLKWLAVGDMRMRTMAEHVEEAIAEADVILVEPVVQPDYTKSRDDRDGDVGLTPANYKITRDLLFNKAKSDAILLHSLPRMDEIPTDVDITKWSRYWQEAFNGVVMRMALLALISGKME